MKCVDLLSGSWYGDRPLSLHFPDDWDVRVVGPGPSAPLDGTAIADRIAHPLGSPDLPALARGKKNAVIIIDDLTRPTPVAPVLQALLEILGASGITPERTTVLVACGSHPSRHDRLGRKTGELERQGVRVICHDARVGCVAIGSTRGGIPVEINRAVVEADVRIAVGGVYPHTFAGYSGGGKIILPGVSGIGTIQRMHDSLQGADIRGGRVDTEVRRVMSEAASMARLDFLVDAVLDERRGIAELFAGECDAVYAAAVAYSRRARMVDWVREADIVVADSYPFDLDFQTLLYRGFWPFWYAREGATKVAVAACSEGVGTHELFPVHRTLLGKVARRISRLRPSEILHPGKIVRSLGYYTKSRGERFFLLTEGVTQEEISPIYPMAEVHRSWEEILAVLKREHAGRRPVVALYRAAPLQVPRLD